MAGGIIDYYLFSLGRLVVGAASRRLGVTVQMGGDSGSWMDVRVGLRGAAEPRGDVAYPPDSPRMDLGDRCGKPRVRSTQLVDPLAGDPKNPSDPGDPDEVAFLGVEKENSPHEHRYDTGINLFGGNSGEELPVSVPVGARDSIDHGFGR